MYRLISVFSRRGRCRALLAAAAAVCITAVCTTALLLCHPLSAVPAASDGGTEAPVCLPIIMYHGLLKEASRQGRYVISPAMFEEDLRQIRQQGYTTVVMADLIAYTDGTAPLPEKPIMLTFDDGYYNNYLYAYPLLKEYGMRAVISPVVSWSEFYSAQDSDHAIYSHITWEEMREMTADGTFEIQNHSYDMHYSESGRRKGTLPCTGESVPDYQQALREDLTKAQEHLTRLAGVTPTTFTYPYGAMSDEALPVIRELGFQATLTCESRINRITRDPGCLMGLGRYLRPNTPSSAAYFRTISSALADAVAASR